MNKTQIKVLMPYKWNTIWVFDDKETGLVREAFVAGADDVMDDLSKDFKKPEKGFVLMFSHEPFPGATHSFTKKRTQGKVGTNYNWDRRNKNVWLCPALFQYFPEAPKRIFAMAKEK